MGYNIRSDRQAAGIQAVGEAGAAAIAAKGLAEAEAMEKGGGLRKI